MINLEWVQHRSGVHQMFPSSTDIKDAEGNVLVTSYAVHRPDGNWSIMLVNRDQDNSHTVQVQFEDSKNKQNCVIFRAGHVRDFRKRAVCLDQRRPNQSCGSGSPAGRDYSNCGSGHCVHFAESLNYCLARKGGRSQGLKPLPSVASL